MCCRKAFTLVEMLAVLILISAFSLIASEFVFPKLSDDVHYFEEQLIHTQWLSMISHKDQIVNLELISVHYSPLSNVINPQTVLLNHKEFVIGFGVGRIYEKSATSD